MSLAVIMILPKNMYCVFSIFYSIIEIFCVDAFITEGSFHWPYGSVSLLEQGSPFPGLWTSTSLRPVRNWAAQQEVSGRRASKASSASPLRSPSLALLPEPSLPVPGAKKMGTAVLEHVVQMVAGHVKTEN